MNFLAILFVVIWWFSMVLVSIRFWVSHAEKATRCLKKIFVKDFMNAQSFVDGKLKFWHSIYPWVALLTTLLLIILISTEANSCLI